MIDELIARVKDMYHQLERDEARLERRTVENLKFGVIPDGAPLEEELGVEPSPSLPGAPPAVAPPEVEESLLDIIAAARPTFPFKPARRPPMPPRPYDPEREPH